MQIHFAAVLFVALAQVGMIIQSNEPHRAEQLLQQAKGVVRQVRAATGRAPLSPSARAKVEASARAMLAEARSIQEDARRGVLLSLGEQDQLDRALAGTRKICAWLTRPPAAPAATASPSSPGLASPSPR